MKKITYFLLLFVLLFQPLLTSAAAPLAAVANPATYDDKDLTVWTYTGSWVNYAATKAYKGSYHLSRALNDEATLTFNGERFELIYTRAYGYGTLAIYVDNVLEASLNQANPTAQFQQRWASPVYTDGVHDVRLVHTSGRYASVDGIQVFGPPDVTSPASISDLAADPGPTGGSASLTWTAPGDDGAAGTATSYLVRYATSAILNETDWNAALSATVGVPAPSTAGSPESMTVVGLAPGITYFFAVRARDEAPNLGDLSNSPSAVALASTPLVVGKYDDRNVNLIFNGTWVNQTPLGAYSKTLRYSQVIGNSVVFMFTGTDFELSYESSNQQGVMAIYIDGQFVANLNQFNSTNKWQKKWNSAVLANATHSVQLIHASGSRVNVDAIQVNLNITVNWPTISLTPVVSGLNAPVLITNAGDGTNRMFIVEKGGTILIYKNNALNSTPFLDITGRVNSAANERGLLSLAFPPNYASKGHFYVFYTDAAGSLTISRFRLTGDPDVADSTSEQIVLSIPHSDNDNHNGGMLAFGPDGYLYFGSGDGGGGGDAPNNAQNLNVLLGKILRIDVETGNPTTYTIPASNPFVGVAGLDEIWAYGVRNPWRYSFDRLTGDMYIGDVGQDAWEEVDFQPAGFAGGSNYGWHVLEGNHCYNPSSGCTPPAGYVPPVAEYNHGSSDSFGCAITGGYVYRGSSYPSMYGIYFYSDYCTGRMLAMQNVSGTWVTTQLLDTPYNVSSFGEDEAGNLYVVDLGGAIYQIVSP
jgi:glucose/arabinose dehydrogenase